MPKLLSAAIAALAGLATLLPYHAAASPVAAVLPSSRSVQVGTSATVFATVINADSITATGCAVALNSALNLTFAYQTTDAATNALTGTINTPVDIGAGGNQSFLLSITPNDAFRATAIEFSFTCANTGTAPVANGINTLLLAASNTPVVDVIAIALTPSGDGIAQLASDGAFGFFALATANVGAADDVTVTPSATITLTGALVICETNPTTAACLEPPSASVTTTMPADDTRTYAVFAQSTSAVALDPAGSRLNVTFTDPAANVRGATSVAMSGGGFTAAGFFEANLSQQVVQSNCIECHVMGGQASATRIIYQPSSSANFVSANFEQLASFVAAEPMNDQIVLNKSQGGLGHGGGVRLQAGSKELADLAEFLTLLVAE